MKKVAISGYFDPIHVGHLEYIDIVERTGSGIYDVELKARLGDLSGLSSGLRGRNLRMTLRKPEMTDFIVYG